MGGLDDSKGKRCVMERKQVQRRTGMSKHKEVYIWIAAAVAIILCLFFAAQGFQNKAIAMEEQVETAQSNIDVRFQ